jgi:RNA polymerase sigma factor (sigma-70 family)
MGKARSELISGFYTQYRRLIFAFIRRKTGDREQAEELTQEVYLRLLKSDKLEQIQHPNAFLHRVALNVLIDWRRAEAVRAATRDENAAQVLLFTNEVTPERETLAREALEILKGSIEKLPRKSRQVFILHKIHRLSHADIARRLEISNSAIEKHLERGMARVRADFERAFRDPREGS